MDFDAMAYPEKFTIAGVEYKGRRNSAKKKLQSHIRKSQTLTLAMKLRKH